MIHGWLLKAHVETSFFSSIILASVILKFTSCLLKFTCLFNHIEWQERNIRNIRNLQIKYQYFFSRSEITSGHFLHLFDSPRELRKLEQAPGKSRFRCVYLFHTDVSFNPKLISDRKLRSNQMEIARVIRTTCLDYVN